VNAIHIKAPTIADVVDEALRQLAACGLFGPNSYTLGIATAVRNAMLNAIRDAMDLGAAGAFIRLYDGSRPATGGSITTLLAELQCSTTSAGNAANGVLILNSITQDPSANASGTATWFRIVDSDGTFVTDGNCGTSGSDMNLTTTTIVITQPVSISSGTFTAGNA
jgi:hypothetical protein